MGTERQLFGGICWREMTKEKCEIPHEQELAGPWAMASTRVQGWGGRTTEWGGVWEATEANWWRLIAE